MNSESVSGFEGEGVDPWMISHLPRGIAELDYLCSQKAFGLFSCEPVWYSS